MAEELAKAASSDQMLRNLGLTGAATLQDGCVGIYQRRQRLQHAVVRQCLFYTQFVAKVAQATMPKQERPAFTIGLIGGGLVGRSLVNLLLARGYPAEDIAISTRSPHQLAQFAAVGIRCVFDNAQVASQSRLLFLLCLPAQIPTVMASLRGHIRRRCLVVSAVIGFTERKLAQLLQTPVVVCARTHVDFARMEPKAVVDKMEKFRVSLLEEAASNRKKELALTRPPSRDAISADAMSRGLNRFNSSFRADSAAAAAAAAAAETQHGDESKVGERTVKPATVDSIIAEAVSQESMSARASRLLSATSGTREKIEKAWSHVEGGMPLEQSEHERRRDEHIELLRTQYKPPAEEVAARESMQDHIAALHLCRQDEQLRRVFVVLAYFAMKCGIPHDFAQLVACQELLGTDVGDVRYLTEQAREKVARKHRRPSGIGPIVHRAPSDDVPTLEFPLAMFIVEGRLPVFWRQFHTVVETAQALDAIAPPIEESGRRRSSVASNAAGGRQRSSAASTAAGPRRKSSTTNAAGGGRRRSKAEV